jgi:type IV pilus assembly protein PilB
MVTFKDSPGKNSLSDIIKRNKLLSEKKLEEAEKKARQEKQSLHQVLIEDKYLTRKQILKAMGEAWNVRYIDLEDVEIDTEIVKAIPENVARRYLAVPFEKKDKILSVAMSDPRDFVAAEDINLRTGLEVKTFLGISHDISAVLDKAYGRDENTLIDKLLSSVSEDSDGELTLEDGEIQIQRDVKTDIADIDASAPEIEKIVNAIILGAINRKASDIHVEPFEDPMGSKSNIIIRYRVDGMLADADFSIPWTFRNAIIAKIKIMTNSMDITERRIPQSGRIQILAKGNPIEFRVEVIPTVYGESCVLRILDRKAVQVDINKLMFSPDTHKSYLSLLEGIGGKKNFGLILVCGPTGSGKSTTLYASLNYVNRPDIKILTAENPVEYNIDRIVQVPVNPDIKLAGGKHFGFAMALRSFLRLDPDVIMVGEIRDTETARICMEAAMTGHLVFSTIHTNDAPSAVSRLVEMGIPSYIVAATLRAVMSQRLARRLCPACKQAYEPNPEDRIVFKEHQVEIPSGAKIYKAMGCPECSDVGFKGRIGIHELLVLSESFKKFALDQMDTEALRRKAIDDGMRTLMQDGLLKVLQGHTTIREVLGGADEKVVE